MERSNDVKRSTRMMCILLALVMVFPLQALAAPAEEVGGDTVLVDPDEPETVEPDEPEVVVETPEAAETTETPQLPESGNSGGTDLIGPDTPETPGNSGLPEVTVTNPEEDVAEDTEQDIVEVFPDGIEARGDDSTIAFVPETAEEILNLVGDVSAARAGTVLNAYSLVGKVSYFWGGKSTVIGWDERWGNPAYVTSGGSSKSGTLQTYGLDCSGFVNWALVNAAGYDIADMVGHGTTGQWNLSDPVDWDDAQPGDLAFFYDPAVAGSMNHVGIVVGRSESGSLLVAHCASSASTVVVTEAASTGFNYIRSPHVYEDKAVENAAYQKDGLGNLMLWLNADEVAIESVRLGDIVFTAEPVWGGQVEAGRVLCVVGDMVIVSWEDSGMDCLSVEELAGMVAVRRTVEREAAKLEDPDPEPEEEPEDEEPQEPDLVEPDTSRTDTLRADVWQPTTLIP